MPLPPIVETEDDMTESTEAAYLDEEASAVEDALSAIKSAADSTEAQGLMQGLDDAVVALKAKVEEWASPMATPPGAQDMYQQTSARKMMG